MNLKTDIQSIAPNNLTPAYSETRLPQQKESSKLEACLAATEDNIKHKMALANNPNIDLVLAKILRYDEEPTVRQAIINNPNVPCFFKPKITTVSAVLRQMEDTIESYLQLLKSAITVQSELYEDRTGDPNSRLAIIELNETVAITTTEFALKDIALNRPITYQVWLLSKDKEQLRLETLNLNKAVSKAIYIIETNGIK